MPRPHANRCIFGWATALWLAASAPAFAEDALGIAVSILPQRELVERVAGDRAAVRVLVDPGEAPETFTIGPREMAELMEVDAVLIIGLPFERALAARLSEVAPGLLVVDISDGIERRRMEGHRHTDGIETRDPHLWLDPVRVRTMAASVRRILCRLDPGHCDRFEANLEAYLDDLESVTSEVDGRLRPFSGRAVCVFHPAYGYFLDRFGLRQIAIEVDGREPTPRQMVALLDELRDARTTTIFVEPQRSGRGARAIADQIGGELVVLDPLAPDLLINYQRMADAIAAALAR